MKVTTPSLKAVIARASIIHLAPSDIYGSDGVARLFRPGLNMDRMVKSADWVALLVGSNHMAERLFLIRILSLSLFPQPRNLTHMHS